jgi:hypothetical protein
MWPWFSLDFFFLHHCSFSIPIISWKLFLSLLIVWNTSDNRKKVFCFYLFFWKIYFYLII